MKVAVPAAAMAAIPAWARQRRLTASRVREGLRGCHKMMSPKLTGDKAKWDVLLKQGKPAVIAAVVKGKGAMPAKGGAASDDDAKAATEYMLTQVK